MSNDKNLSHDRFVKKMMEVPGATKELIEECLPAKYKERLDLTTIKPEKDTFIETNLKSKYSDLVYSVKTKDNKDAYIYCLIEIQSSPHYFIAFRLLKYSLLLIERYVDKKKKRKLPIVMPLVIYHGKEKYTVPKNLWELFEDPQLVFELMTGDYSLMDLNAMNDEDIDGSKPISILIYTLKHIFDMGLNDLARNLLRHCRKAILMQDKKEGYIYTRGVFWYITGNTSSDERENLKQVFTDELKEDGEKIMYSIADSYIDEGIQKGRLQGIDEGIEKTAVNMLKEKLDDKLISSVTGITLDDLLKLKSKSGISN